MNLFQIVVLLLFVAVIVSFWFANYILIYKSLNNICYNNVLGGDNYQRGEKENRGVQRSQTSWQKSITTHHEHKNLKSMSN